MLKIMLGENNMRNNGYLLYWKFGWELDPDNKKSSIPSLIWKDHHTSWDRCYYWFKDMHNHKGYPYVFK